MKRVGKGRAIGAPWLTSPCTGPTADLPPVADARPDLKPSPSQLLIPLLPTHLGKVDLRSGAFQLLQDSALSALGGTPLKIVRMEQVRQDMP